MRARVQVRGDVERLGLPIQRIHRLVPQLQRPGLGTVVSHVMKGIYTLCHESRGGVTEVMYGTQWGERWEAGK